MRRARRARAWPRARHHGAGDDPPRAAHAAFHKAAHLFGITVHKTPVRADWTADVDAMARCAMKTRCWWSGRRRNIRRASDDSRHRRAGRLRRRELPRRRLHGRFRAAVRRDARPAGAAVGLPRRRRALDFRRRAQARLRAQGRVGDPARNKQLRAYQTFVFDGWLGGFYASPNLQGTRSGLPMACAWAVMSHLGVDGYGELTRRRSTTPTHARRHRRYRRRARARRRRFHLIAMAGDPRRACSTCSRSVTRFREGLVPRPPDPARLAALDGQQQQHRRDRGLPRGSRGAWMRSDRADDRSTNYATLESSSPIREVV